MAVAPAGPEMTAAAGQEGQGEDGATEPPALEAVMVIVEAPARAGYLVMRPEMESRARPGGRPVALKVEAGLVAVIW